MCYFPNNKELMMAIEDAILVEVQAGNIFTGYDIYTSLEDTYGLPSYQISSFVRELFNAHSVVFAGYACYPIPVGPLVFFPMKADAKVREYVEQVLEKIQKAEKEKEETEAA